MINSNNVPWFLYPFWAVWRLVSLVFQLTGRLIAAVLGLALMIVGVILTVTVVGAIIGVPLAIFGVLLVIRAFF